MTVSYPPRPNRNCISKEGVEKVLIQLKNKLEADCAQSSLLSDITESNKIGYTEMPFNQCELR